MRSPPSRPAPRRSRPRPGASAPAGRRIKKKTGKLADVGKNPDQIRNQQLRAELWRRVRDALDHLMSLPRADEVVAIVGQSRHRVESMKAITLWQPWASLIAVGAKTIETRSWAPPASLIGHRIAIHAARKPAPKDIDSIAESVIAAALDFPPSKRAGLPFGAILCTVTVVGAYRVLTGRGGELGCVDVRERVPGSDPTVCALSIDLFGDFRQGRWLWELGELETFAAPIPAKGAQGFWDWSLNRKN